VTPTTNDALRAVRAELTIDRVRATARSGDLDEALRLLRDLDAAGEANAAALDLLARVHAQRADFTEADACWSRVQDGGDSGDADAEAGRHAIAEIVAGRRSALAPLRPGRLALAGLPLVAVLAAGTVMWLGPDSGGASTSDGARVARRLRQQTERAEALDRQLRTTHDLQAAAAARRTRILEEDERQLRTRGVRVRRYGGGLLMIFATGVFRPNGVELTRDGATLLDRVGTRLPRRATIRVVGHTVAFPGGRTHGGSTVALVRAQAAAARLATAGHRPLTAFTLATADQSDGPYPDDRRNRTVTLQITLLPSGAG